MVAAQDQNILLIEDNPGDARLIREFFTEASPSEFRLHWADRLSKGLDRLDKGDIDLVLLDVSLPDSRGFNTFAQVQNRAPQVPIILITGNDDESLSLQAVRQGAQDFIVKSSANGPTLVRSARYAIERHRASVDQMQDRMRQTKRRTNPGRVIGFLGAKGGVGATTVALNVAAALAGPTRSVIAAELRAEPGSFSYHTRQTNPRNIGSLLQSDTEIVNDSALAACLYSLRPGLKLLYGPQHPDQFGDIKPEQAQAVVRELSLQADITILDLPSSISRHNHSALRMCDYLVLIVEPDPISLLAGQRALGCLDAMGISRTVVGAVVVKRAVVPSYVPAVGIKAQLACAIIGMIPSSIEACSAAEDAATQIVALQPESPAATAFKELAERLAAEPVAPMWIA